MLRSRRGLANHLSALAFQAGPCRSTDLKDDIWKMSPQLRMRALGRTGGSGGLAGYSSQLQ